MAVTKQRKQEILQELTDLFKNAKSVAATSYRGTGVNDINNLRGEMFKKNVSFKVAKKTLIRLAAKEAGYEDVPNEILDGPVALAFSMDDEISGAKSIKDASKEVKSLGLLGGFMDGKILNKADITQLADIPPFEVLMTMFLRAIKGPISGFHGVLHGTLRNFAGVLNAIKEEKEKGGDAVAEVAEEAPAVPAEPAVEEKPAEPAAEEKSAEPAKETPAEETPAAPEADKTEES